MAAAQIYIAAVPLVLAMGDDGKQLYIYEGQPVPSRARLDEIARLLSDGFIAVAGTVKDSTLFAEFDLPDPDNSIATPPKPKRLDPRSRTTTLPDELPDDEAVGS